MWIWLIFVICILIFLYIYIFNTLNYLGDKALFFPSDFDTLYRPSCEYKNLFIDIDTGKYCYKEKNKKLNNNYISAWHFNNFKNKPTVVFFHGTTGNLTNRSYIINFCTKFHLNLFVFDYSGYGESDNSPSKALLKKNADSVYNYLHNVCKINDSDLVLWSESLGCFAASYLASKYKFRALILLSAFSSLPEILKYKIPEGYMQTGFNLLTNILSWQMDFLPVYKYLENVQCRTIIVHSEFDELINWKCAKTNYNTIANISKKLIKITGGHSSPHITTRQLRKIFKFCDLESRDVNSDSISNVLHSLENFAKKNNHFRN